MGAKKKNIYNRLTDEQKINILKMIFLFEETIDDEVLHIDVLNSRIQGTNHLYEVNLEHNKITIEYGAHIDIVYEDPYA